MALKDTLVRLKRQQENAESFEADQSRQKDEWISAVGSLVPSGPLNGVYRSTQVAPTSSAAAQMALLRATVSVLLQRRYADPRWSAIGSNQ